jgi:hypothetical protein
MGGIRILTTVLYLLTGGGGGVRVSGSHFKKLRKTEVELNMVLVASLCNIMKGQFNDKPGVL